MDSQRIRPSLADLTTLDLDAPAFTEWEINHQQPSVSVSRTQPPKIVSSSSTSIPPPVPEIQFDQPTASTSTSTPPAPGPPPSKPKSRFALQREKEAAQRTERFELNLDDHDNDDDDLDNGNSSAAGGGGGALPKATPNFSVVKDVLEKPLNHSPKPPSAPSIRSTGFPPIRKGVFQQQQYKKPISTTTTTTTPRSFEADEYYLDDEGGDSVDGLLRIVSKENESVLNQMSDSQILEEQRQIREEMGLSQGLIKMLQNRAQQKETEKKKIPTPRSRPLPQRKTPTPIVQQDEEEEEEEEGTPEYIRKHFFPNEPVNPALDWMKPPPLTSSSDSSSLPSTFTFDLDGSLVSKTFNVEQGEGGGDHHVSSSTNFTIPSLLSLTSSSVPSQRSTAFLTLLKIISHPSNHSLVIGEKDWIELRLKLLEKASWSLNDSNRGVIISSIDLLHHLFITELERSESKQGQEKKKKVLPNQEIPKTFLDKFNLSNNPLRFISLQFSLKSCTLPRSCLNRLLEILSIYVQLSQNEEELDSSSSKNLDLIFSTSPNLLQSISERFISVPWPPFASDGNELIPSPLALEIFINLTNSSRTCAKQFYKGDNNNDNNNQLVESTLRYLAIPPWEELQEKETKKLGYEMISKVLKFWKSLGKYGLGSELRSLSSSLLEGGGGEGGGGIFDKISEICLNNTLVPEEEEEDLVWISELISLLKIWLVCAVDPHVCQHGITWSKVENWNELGLQLYNYSLSSRNKIELVGKSLELLSEWLQGSKINKSWRGEKEREWIEQHFKKEFDHQGRGRELVENAMRGLAEKNDDDDDVKARMVTSAIRLSQIYKEDSNPPTRRLFSVDSKLVKSVIDSILSSSEPSHNCIELVLVLLPLLEDTSDRLVSTVLVLPFLTTCQAVQARDLIFYLLSTFSTCPPPSLDQSFEIPCLVDLPLLNPFYVHAIVESSNGKVISPSYPTPRDLKLTHSLIDSNKFLLKRDWPLKVLDELLRSNTSPIFNNNNNNGLIPKDWDASESQLVKTCLVLMRIVSNVYSSVKVEVEERSRLLYNLIKVYMLEKDTTTTSQSSSLVERDLFRLPSIEISISKLLLPLQLTSLPPQLLTSSSTSTSPAPLEVISNEQSSSTFYQQFQDFLSLYDSISLSNLNFSLLLLPPLSMKYESDYKKLLWCDYQHLLKNLNKLIRLKHLLTDSNDEEDEGVLSGYLYPIEKNETILKAYLDSLVSSSLFEEEEEEGFFKFVAVHHLSQAIFSGSESGKEDRGLRTRLLKGLIGREKKDLIRLVVRYKQSSRIGDRLRGLKQSVQAIEQDELDERFKIIQELVGDQKQVDFEQIEKIIR